METKINIATILKNKPKGTKLYSTVHGKCTFEAITDEIFKINFYTSKFGLTQSGECTLIKFGNMYDDGECIIFPSKKMRDWSKLAWNTGDILVNKDGNAHVIFEGFDDDTYETFNGNNYLWENEGITMCFGEYEDELPTSDFSKANKEDAQKYIHQIEKRLGYKLNFETLEIEKSEFKDGDIVSLEIRYIDSEDVIVETYIVHGDYNNGENLNFYTGYRDNISDGVIYNSFVRPDKTSVRKELLRYATEEEKQQLFEALAKENKAWDAENKLIVDLKPKIRFKPFDKVVVFDELAKKWECGMFSHYSKNYEGKEVITCIGGCTYFKVLPYNEETAKLIGTKNNPK